MAPRGLKMATWPNLASSWTPCKCPKHKKHIRCSYGFATSPHCVSRCPRWLKDGPKSAQGGPKTAPGPAKMAPRRPQEPPRWPQDGPKATPRQPQDGSRSLPKGFLTSLNLTCLDNLPPSCHLVGHLPPRCLQVASKMAPRGLHMPTWPKLASSWACNMSPLGRRQAPLRGLESGGGL